jgi:DNA-binding protein YbaB
MKISESLLQLGADAVSKSVLSALVDANTKFKQAGEKQISSLFGGLGGI